MNVIVKLRSVDWEWKRPLWGISNSCPTCGVKGHYLCIENGAPMLTTHKARKAHATRLIRYELLSSATLGIFALVIAAIAIRNGILARRVRLQGPRPAPVLSRRRRLLNRAAGPAVVAIVFVALWGIGLDYTPPCSTYPADFVVRITPAPGQPHVAVNGVDRHISTDLWQNASTGQFVNGTGLAAFQLELARSDVHTMDAVMTASWSYGRTSGLVGKWEWTKADGRTAENVTAVMIEGGSSASLNLTVTFAPSNHTAPYRYYFINGFVLACEEWTMITELRIE